jgi:hypothetical protein
MKTMANSTQQLKRHFQHGQQEGNAPFKTTINGLSRTHSIKPMTIFGSAARYFLIPLTITKLDQP